MSDDANNDETGKWVILRYFPYSPVDVYGLFDSEQEALEYADRKGLAVAPGAYEIKMVLNAHIPEEQFDPAQMGWVGRNGRP
jgi:hypothetical protein